MEIHRRTFLVLLSPLTPLLAGFIGQFTGSLLAPAMPKVSGPVWCEPASASWVCGVEALPYQFGKIGQKVVHLFYHDDGWLIRMCRLESDGVRWHPDFMQGDGTMDQAKMAAMILWNRSW